MNGKQIITTLLVLIYLTCGAVKNDAIASNAPNNTSSP